MTIEIIEYVGVLATGNSKPTLIVVSCVISNSTEEDQWRIRKRLYVLVTQYKICAPRKRGLKFTNFF